MRLPLSWIKEYLEFDKTSLELESVLTSMGLEVDSIEDESLPFDNVVVALVEKVSKHPNADKLVVAEVNDGLATHQVVCGDPQCREGMKTAFARIGAKLQDPKKNEFFEIKPTKIRGVESFGMLCALDELGVDNVHSGIVELPQDAKIGESVYPYFGDKIFEISITPNLGHALCVIGVARELSAGLGVPLNPPPIIFHESDASIDPISVNLENPEDCLCYAVREFKGLKVGPSPLWMKRRLEASGIRSINNVVDITNYVMLELGQPLHAFDLNHVKGGISVRRAKEGEKLALLDGREKELNSHVLVISDSQKPLAVAGIMGGVDSSVTENTQDILLESACFNPSTVRKGCKELSISTDSSKRFERGIDPRQIVRALDRAAMLIEEICGVKPLKGLVKAGNFEKDSTWIECRLSRIGEILGLHVSLNEAETIFKRLHFNYKWDGKNTFTVEAPSYRNDLKLEIDLIEEVARVIGYQNIPKKTPYFTLSNVGHAPLFLFEREVRNRLISEGLQEFITCDLISPEQSEMLVLSGMDPKSIVSVSNPTSVEQSVLRASLIPGLLSVVKRNFDYQNQNITGFEMGKIHFKADDRYKEQSMASLVFSGLSVPHSWDSTDRLVDFYDLKGVLENVFSSLRIEGVTFEPSSLTIYHPGRQAKVLCQGLEFGTIGEIHPQLQRQLDIPERIYAAELNLNDLLAVRSKPKKMEQLPLYPSSSRDWTVTVKEEVPVSHLFSAISSIDSPYLESIKLKYIYRSDKLGEKKKNVTIHFIYRDLNETIENRTVDLEHARIVELAIASIKTS